MSDVAVTRNDLTEVRDLLDLVLHKCIAEDLVKQYCNLGRPKASPLTNSVEDMVARLTIYLVEEDPNAAAED